MLQCTATHMFGCRPLTAAVRVKSLDVGDLDRFAPKQYVWHKKARSCFEASTFFHSFAAIAKAC